MWKSGLLCSREIRKKYGRKKWVFPVRNSIKFYAWVGKTAAKSWKKTQNWIQRQTKLKSSKNQSDKTYCLGRVIWRLLVLWNNICKNDSDWCSRPDVPEVCTHAVGSYRPQTVRFTFFQRIRPNLTPKWPKWNKITRRIWWWMYQEHFVNLSITFPVSRD